MVVVAVAEAVVAVVVGNLLCPQDLNQIKLKYNYGL
jgi:hypothetical protein